MRGEYASSSGHIQQCFLHPIIFGDRPSGTLQSLAQLTVISCGLPASYVMIYFTSARGVISFHVYNAGPLVYLPSLSMVYGVYIYI